MSIKITSFRLRDCVAKWRNFFFVIHHLLLDSRTEYWLRSCPVLKAIKRKSKNHATTQEALRPSHLRKINITLCYRRPSQSSFASGYGASTKPPCPDCLMVRPTRAFHCAGTDAPVKTCECRKHQGNNRRSGTYRN